MAIYVSGILIAQDMIAIRSAIAVGFFLLAIKYRLDNRIWHYMFFSLCAFLFHYSAIILIPLYFISKEKEYFALYFLLIPIAYISVINDIGVVQFFELIHIDTFQLLWANYKYFEESDAYNIYNFFILGKCLMYYFILFNIKTISKHCPMALYLMKIYCISIFLTVLLREQQSLAIRIGEFLQSVEIVLIPLILYAFNGRRKALMHYVCAGYCAGLLLCYGIYFF